MSPSADVVNRKCGEILMTVKNNSKNVYSFNCWFCDAIYVQMKKFTLHLEQEHEQQMGSGHNEQAAATTDCKKYNKPLDDTSNGEFITEIKMEDCMVSDIKSEIEEDQVETSSFKMDPLTIVKQEQCPDKEESIAIESAESEDNIGSDNESLETGKHRNSFVRDFIKSKNKLTTFISAYKNQPLLWNTNSSVQIRFNDRPNYLQQIAKEVDEQINVQMTIEQVAAVIHRLRRDYRVKVNRYKCEVSNKKSAIPACCLEQLEFLKPFMEINSLTNFDSLQPELSEQQVIQILNIYKRFPHLWNSNLIEYVCTNKRLEALTLMQDAIKSEMGLTINKNSLKRYIYSIYINFSREKRRNMANDITDGKCIYYQHMTYLFDHVSPFWCSQCNREFHSPLNLKAHQSQHDDLNALTCSLCKKRYKSVEAYTFHAKRHMHDLKEECDECGKKFMRLADLNIHKRSHTGDTPYCCEICGVSYRYSQELTNHRKRHIKQYRHKCPTCLKGFYEKDRMKLHMKSHSNIRDFDCNICGKAFKLKKTLKQHIFTHEEGRNHLCTLCGKNFKNKIGLSHHMRTHRKKIEIDETK